MPLVCIDTFVVLAKWTIFNPLLSLTYLLALGCELHEPTSSRRWLQDGFNLARSLPAYAPQHRWSIAAAAVTVLLGWCLVLSSHLWYNRVHIAPIRSSDWKQEFVIVTGGAAGIGYCTAVQFAAKGAKVVVIDIHELPALDDSATSDELQARPNISAYVCDLASEDALAKVIKSILAIHGAPSVVFNNAGVTNSQQIVALSTAQITRLISVNLTAHLWMLHHLLPHMIQRVKDGGRAGHIVSTASVMGHTGVSQMVDYCASKHGVVGLHKALRYELDYGYRCPQIRTTLVVLGHVKTKLFDGVKWSFLVRFLGPSVEPDAVAKQIVRAVQSRRGGTIAMPWYANWTEAFALLPSWVADFAHWLLESHTSMQQMNEARAKMQ